MGAYDNPRSQPTYARPQLAGSRRGLVAQHCPAAVILALDEFARLCKAAGLQKIRLHDCRHSTNSLLEHLGVSDSIRASWFGHTIAVNRGTYTHARPEDLAVVSDVLSGLSRPMWQECDKTGSAERSRGP